jgi:hypothetical protein
MLSCLYIMYVSDTIIYNVIKIQLNDNFQNKGISDLKSH